LIGDETIALGERDIFVAPSWTPVRLRARSELILFSYSDKAAQQKLHLYREALA
jgi:gentisate 1,2-dioxygenase